MRGVVLDEVVSLLPAHTLDVWDFVPELDAVELVCVLQQLRPESGRDELRAGAQLVDDVSDAFAVGSVQSLRNYWAFVKVSLPQVYKWCIISKKVEVNSHHENRKWGMH